MTFREESEILIREILDEVHPEASVKRALSQMKLDQTKKIYLIAVGKAAWAMADSAFRHLGEKISAGIVLTKYRHSKGPIGNLLILEAGHPVPDENSYAGAEKILQMVAPLSEEDQVLFLLSGGGSSLFEKPFIPVKELEDITGRLLCSGADIIEINTLRKRFSKVKAGRFAEACFPASVFSIVLSDIIGDPLDMIASGPAYPDSSTKEDAKRIVRKYSLPLSEEALTYLEEETPKTLTNINTVVTGSVKVLCKAAEKAVKTLGYRPIFLTDCLNCEARDAGKFLASIAKSHRHSKEKLCFICGGETVVHVQGKGKGGRNQEIALAAADGIRTLSNVALFSLGSDGTDGPTDAAGGFVDGFSAEKIEARGQSLDSYLKENNAYEALGYCDGLLLTGPTGTNVNDVTVLLIKPEEEENASSSHLQLP